MGGIFLTKQTMGALEIQPKPVCRLCSEPPWHLCSGCAPNFTRGLLDGLRAKRFGKCGTSLPSLLGCSSWCWALRTLSPALETLPCSSGASQRSSTPAVLMGAFSTAPALANHRWQQGSIARGQKAWDAAVSCGTAGPHKRPCWRLRRHSHFPC